MTPSPTTIDLAGALPSRPVAVTPPTVAPLGVFGMFALLFALLGGLLWWLGPDLARDWRIGGAAPAENVRIEEARCRSWLALLHLCDVTLVDDRNGSAARRTLWYAFIDAEGTPMLSAGRTVRGAARPELVSTTFGLEKRLARSGTLALAVTLLGLCVAAAWRVTQQGWRHLRAFRGLSGQRLVPVVVEIERHNLVPPRRRMWVYVYDDGGRQERAFIELTSKDRPLFTDASEKRALALRGEGGGTPLLLDAQLNCLDLTGAEKEAFYAACRAAFAGHEGRDAG
jgi:hypothetical protein